MELHSHSSVLKFVEHNETYTVLIALRSISAACRCAL